MTRRRPGAPRVALVLAVGAVLLGGCGGSGRTASTTAATGPAPEVRTGVRGDRYCEVLLVTPRPDGSASAGVYSTYPLNDCPPARWGALDPAEVAASAGVPQAVLNGPRYWLMDRIEKVPVRGATPAVLGGIEMQRQATVEIAANAARAPFTPSPATRRAVFVFDAGTTVDELLAADGTRWVMQTWTQQKDATLTSEALATLGNRLELPAGWRYETRRLDAPLRIDATRSSAQVLQDNLGNSYARVPSG